jgi:hypothetical protein
MLLHGFFADSINVIQEHKLSQMDALIVSKEKY